MKKIYSLGNVHYGFQGKWKFTAQNATGGLFTVLYDCGGKPVADKVAKQVVGGLKRTGGTGLDNLARVQIEKLVTA